MTNALRERVARAIAKVDFLRDQHSGFIGQSHTFGDDWIGSVHYEMADAALERMKREARNEALREAAEATQEVSGIKPFSSVADVKSLISRSILARITEDQSDE